MFDEKELMYAQFWGRLKKRVMTFERNYERDLDKGLLQLLFLVALDQELLAIHLPKRPDFRPLLHAPSTYEFDQRWSKIREELRDLLRHLKGAVNFSSVIDRDFFVQAFEALSSELAHERHDVVELFDYLFFKSVAADLKLNSRYTSMVAKFSSVLAGSSERCVEAFPLTGEFLSLSVAEGELGVPTRNIAGLRVIAGWELELNLRFMIMGVHLELNTSYLDHSDTSTFTLIDVPRYLPTSRSGAFRRFQSIETASSALEMLDVLLKHRHHFQGVVVVRGSDRSALKGEVHALRQWLVNSEMLMAVIDLPSGRGKSSASHSAWVLRAHARNSQQQVLMADLRGLLPPSHRDDWNALGEFAARLVFAWENEYEPAIWSTEERTKTLDKRLRNIYRREFSGGYRDVPGLCSGVTREQLQANQYRLIAGEYLASQERRIWVSGLDYSPIIRLLSDMPKLREPIYIIGNNGEGKSLLLRELADFSVSEGRSTIGIAFGFSDRFQHGPQKMDKESLFRYEGTRSPNLTASGKKLALDVGRKIFEIHCIPERLAAFNAGLELLDFRARRYLVPYTVGAGGQDRDFGISSIVELTDDIEENLQAAAFGTLGDMQPAFGRMSSRSEVTPFSELSSGEQQVLALMVKIAVSAEPNSLILIDEPEISLHVSWQRVLPTLLSNMCQHFGCDIVVATHSPILVTSALSSSSYCFAAKDQQLTALGVRDRGSVERVLFSGFNTHTENNRQVHERCASIVSETIQVVNAKQKNPQAIAHFQDELNSMHSTVNSASGLLRRASLDNDLVLIEKTQEALAQLAGWAREEREVEG